MQVTKKQNSPTNITLTITSEGDELQTAKTRVLDRLAKDVKVSGFRPGKAPREMVEKQVDQAALQQQFLEEALEMLYPDAARQEKLRPVDRPEVNIKKFVPFNTLEFDATVDVLGDVELPDYKKIKKERSEPSVTKKDVDEVLENLRTREATKSPVERAAKNGDQVLIDFSGKDQKSEPIPGAEGKDYPLALGSGTFIPGFEENLVGMKPAESKQFSVPFPKDYGVSALAGKKVTFDVTVKEVQEVVKPELTDEFAASVGPVKTMTELKRDIKKELTTEKQRQADMEFESELVKEITQKAKADVPKPLIDEQVERMLRELKQNLTYRGQTLEEYLKQQGTTEEKYRKEELAPEAEQRVKASIVLAEIAETEKIEVTPEELEIRMQVLKGQYKDPQMQAELEKPETRREIASRMLSEKTVAQLASYATKK